MVIKNTSRIGYPQFFNSIVEDALVICVVAFGHGFVVFVLNGLRIDVG